MAIIIKGDSSNRPDGFGIETSEGLIEIVNIIVIHNYGDGIDSKAKRTYIHECIVANNSCDGVKLWVDSSKVENTLIYGRGDGKFIITPWSPIVISTEDTNAYFEIINCTVDDSLGENYIMHVQYDWHSILVYLRMVNNIFSGRGNNAPVIWLSDSVHYQINYNLFYLMPQGYQILIRGTQVYNYSQVVK